MAAPADRAPPPTTPSDDVPTTSELRRELERIRADLDRALAGELQRAEDWQRRAEDSAARVRALEAERARAQAAMAALASRLAAFERAERALRAEIAARDDRLAKLAEIAERWDLRVQELLVLKERSGR